MPELATAIARHIVAIDPSRGSIMDPTLPRMATTVLADALRRVDLGSADYHGLEAAIVAANPRIIGYELPLAPAKTIAVDAARAFFGH